MDVNSNKLGNTVEQRNGRLAKLIEAIGDLWLGNYGDQTIDAFGDAYEYLMSMYASNAGKSGGEFFTPQEVSELLAEITTVGKTEVNKCPVQQHCFTFLEKWNTLIWSERVSWDTLFCTRFWGLLC
jgi:type I restriction-modification system DNA methylase subunit